MLQILMISMFFFVTIAAFASYTFYYSQYQKLARYFLCNMFRFPSSYYLMSILYGAKPFLKGAVHALMYKIWDIQIWTLFGIELTSLIIMLCFEFISDNHRSKPVFMMDACYSFCLLLLNILFLCKYSYFQRNRELKEICEELLTNIVYFMLIVLTIKFIW